MDEQVEVPDVKVVDPWCPIHGDHANEEKN